MSDFKPTIKPLVRDRHSMGVPQNFQPLLRPPTQSSVTTFAQTIGQRYQTQRNSGSAMSLALQRPVPMATLQSTQHVYQTQYSPHLAFVLLHSQVNSQLDSQPSGIREILPSPQIKFQSSLVMTEQWVHRLNTRTERIETVISSSHKTNPFSGSRDAPLAQNVPLAQDAPLAQRSSPQQQRVQAQPITQIVRQSIPAVVMESSFKERPGAYPDLHQPPLRESINPYPAAIHRPSAHHPGFVADPTDLIDVNRLTDQVVQAIDRRMTAYRERLGRSG